MRLETFEEALNNYTITVKSVYGKIFELILKNRMSSIHIKQSLGVFFLI